MNYALTITVPMSYEHTVTRVREELANQGFGILTEIDVNATFDTKLGNASSRALGDYLILGACNPALAERALAAEPDLGLLLPCNVVIRRDPSATTTTVQAIDPQTMAQLSHSPGVQAVADEAGDRLLAALAALRGEISAP